MILPAIAMSFGLIVLAGLIGMLASQISSRSLPPNGDLGIRTKATKTSPAAWYAGHEAARPILSSAWIVVLGLAAVTVVVGALASETWTVVLAGGIAYVVTVGLILLAAARANEAARQVD